MSTEPSHTTGESDHEPPSGASDGPAVSVEDAPAPDAPAGGAETDTDPWSAFGPAVPRPPSRLRRAARAIGRPIVHEWTLACLGALLLAVLMTWPTLRDPARTIPEDIWDPTLQAWQLAWSGHALLTDPSHLWDANAFFPDRLSFAFSDTLLGYAPAGMIGSGPVAALIRYNIIFMLAWALAFLGPYALVRQLGAGRIGAAVAGAAFASAPWRLGQAGHLHVLSSGGIALALAMLARGHGWSLRHGYRPQRRHPGWALAGWLVAAWQITLGFGIGLPFVYVLGGIGLVGGVAWLVRGRKVPGARPGSGIRLLVANLGGGLLFAATGVLMARPYFAVAQLHPYARRSIGDLQLFSPPLSGFLTAPEQSRVWGQAHAAARSHLTAVAEMALLPGFALYGLALAGLFVSIWSVRQRLLLFAGVLVSVALAMGTQFFGGTVGYVALFRYLPGWDGLRTPGRLVLWTTLLLGILAAGAVAEFVTRAYAATAEVRPRGPGVFLRLALLLPLTLVLLEGLNAMPHPVVPTEPAAIHGTQGPLLVLPTRFDIDNNVMLWSTDGFPKIVNGNSGFLPHNLQQTQQVATTFPDSTSVDYLRRMGVTTVILLKGWVPGTPWAEAANTPVDGLGITREDVGDAVVFHLAG